MYNNFSLRCVPGVYHVCTVYSTSLRCVDQEEVTSRVRNLFEFALRKPCLLLIISDSWNIMGHRMSIKYLKLLAQFWMVL